MKYTGPSSLEEKIMKVLNKAKISYDREVKFNRFHVGFLIKGKKLAIECDGEFWHMQAKIKERDKRKDKLLASLGYKVMRFSGQDIIRSSEKELSRLILSKL